MGAVLSCITLVAAFIGRKIRVFLIAGMQKCVPKKCLPTCIAEWIQAKEQDAQAAAAKKADDIMEALNDHVTQAKESAESEAAAGKEAASSKMAQIEEDINTVFGADAQASAGNKNYDTFDQYKTHYQTDETKQQQARADGKFFTLIHLVLALTVLAEYAWNIHTAARGSGVMCMAAKMLTAPLFKAVS